MGGAATSAVGFRTDGSGDAADQSCADVATESGADIAVSAAGGSIKRSSESSGGTPRVFKATHSMGPIRSLLGCYKGTNEYYEGHHKAR